MFIATINSMNLHPALADRLEVLKISGYTESEKVHIAFDYLLPKQLEENCLKSDELEISEPAMQHLIRKYTREAGVRSLERVLANISRKTLRKIESSKLSKEKVISVKVTKNNIRAFAGIEQYPFGAAELENRVGVTAGLAWTERGGEILYVEALIFKGSGKIICTGKLGTVMQESVSAAISFIKSRSDQYGIKPEMFKDYDIHVHLPEGATPKDGPSAGITICTSVLSALLKKPVDGNLAMTGELSLRGRVLPIGGLKEKILAAHLGGLEKIILPEENKKDLEEVPKEVLVKMNISYCRDVGDVLSKAILDL